MSRNRRRWTIGFGLMLALALVLACSAPARILGELPSATLVEELPGAQGPEPGGEAVPVEPPALEPLVVTHRGSAFNVSTLDGSLIETRSAEGLDYARPNTAQVVGESIYYVDTGGQGLGGVVRRATSSGTESLDFTAAEDMDTLTFAVSDDETRIAWTHSFFGQASRFSKLYIAGIDGSNTQMIVETGPPYELPDYYALEAVRWLGDDLIYAYQVTGIGGYILFFGWSSFYRYSPADGSSTPLVPVSEEGVGPCWYTVSPDGLYAVGGCGEEGIRERTVADGAETILPVTPDQGQQGGAAYSPSGERLAYAVARGNPEQESGQVLVRRLRGEDPIVLSTQTPGFFERILWVDEERMVVGVYDSQDNYTDLLDVQGTRTRLEGGRLIGLMQPAPVAGSAPGLAAQVERGEIELVDMTANGEIAGPGVEVVVRNPGTEEITVIIPCGFFFEPEDPGDQRLMVVQEARAVVPPGGEAELTAYVVCIDATSETPSEGAAYRLGSMQSGDLLKLAQCACREDLSAETNFMQGMGIMITGWAIAEGKSPEELQAEGGEGAMGEAFGGGMGDLLGLLGGLSGDWNEKCDIPRP